MADTAKVYNKTYELLQRLFRISDDVPKKWRRALWEKTLGAATDLIALILYAYESIAYNERLVYLDRALTKFTVLNTYLRLCNENAIIPTQKMTNIAELTSDISQQLGSWRKATAERMKSV